MENKPLETNRIQTPNIRSELILNNDEIEHLAKFLDALLESDLASKDDGDNDND